jgi:hypothetical protein
MEFLMRFVPLLALLAFAAPAAAQDSQPASTPPKKEKKICKAVAVTGSILGGKRECRTKAEWDSMAQSARDNLDRRDRDLAGRNGGLGVSRTN